MVTEVWRLELRRGLRCMATGELDAAEAHFARAYRSAPERPEVCFALGRERMRQGRLEEAERLLRSAWTRDRMLAAGAALARCVGQMPGRAAEAHAIVDEALARTPNEPGLLVVRAELFLDEERLEDARASLVDAERILDEEGRRAPATREAIQACSARAWNLEGIELGREDRADEALFAFKRAFDLNPTWAGPLVNMGAAFGKLGRVARARACYERALVIEPKNPVALYNLGLSSRERGDLGAAAATLLSLVEAEPDYPGARRALAETLLEQGQAAPAIDLLDRQLEKSPDDAGVWFQLGIAHELAGDGEKAEQSLRGALARDPRHVPACCRLATLLSRSGRYLEAAELVRRAQTLDPARAAALAALEAEATKLEEAPSGDGDAG